MSLYDDEDLGAPPTEVAVGWSTGAKMMQSQLQVKKPKMGPPKSNLSSSLIPSNKSRLSSTPILAPVIDLKSRKYMEESSKGPVSSQRTERVSLEIFRCLDTKVDVEVKNILFLGSCSKNEIIIPNRYSIFQ